MRILKLWFWASAVFLLSPIAEAFLPPVVDILREVTSGRKPGPVELVLRHRISVKGAGVVEVDERILRDRNQFYFIWAGASLGQSLSASWAQDKYQMGNTSFPSRSIAMVAALSARGPEDLRDSLISEQFIQREHLYQFKPGYNPSGDPVTWETRENYLRHPEIFLKKLSSGVAIAIGSANEGNETKAVCFDKGLKGLRRFEWQVNQQTFAWNFEGFAPFAAGGLYPRRLSFESNGVEVIQSELTAVRAATARTLSDFKTAWRQAQKGEVTPAAEGILKLLLSYR